jgi:hypothetical protein
MRRWMGRAGRTLALVMLAALVAPGGTIAGADPVPAATDEASGPVTPRDGSAAGDLGAWLSGPFGRVAGLPLEDGAAPDGRAMLLDTFVRGVPLTLDLGDRDRAFAAWRVTATPAGPDPTGAASPPTLLAEGDGRPPLGFVIDLAAPDVPGEHLLVAEVRDAAGREARAGWRVQVPDVDPPEDGLLDLAAPVILLETAAGPVAGLPGNGCYVYTCVEIGRGPPTRDLEPTLVAPGEPLTVRLDDGSRFTVWSVTWRRLGGPGGYTEEWPAAEPAASALLEAPAEGEWLLVVTVTFDRERGWFAALHRLSVR